MNVLRIPDSFDEKDLFLGMTIRPNFSDSPMGRMRDMWYELDLPKDFDRSKVEDIHRGMYSDIHGGPVRYEK